MSSPEQHTPDQDRGPVRDSSAQSEFVQGSSSGAQRGHVAQGQHDATERERMWERERMRRMRERERERMWEREREREREREWERMRERMWERERERMWEPEPERMREQPTTPQVDRPPLREVEGYVILPPGQGEWPWFGTLVEPHTSAAEVAAEPGPGPSTVEERRERAARAAEQRRPQQHNNDQGRDGGR